MPHTIFFVRHGQTEWNAARRMQGQWNSDLSALGRAQAAGHARLLERFGVQALIASPLGRTRETASIINERLQLPLSFDERIMEWDCGDWSGERYAEVETNWPEQWAAFQADRFNYRPPKAENYPDMLARAEPFLAELLEHESGCVAVVSHGLIGRAMLGALLKLSPAQLLEVRQPNDTVFRVSLQPGGRVVDRFVAEQGPFAGLGINGEG